MELGIKNKVALITGAGRGIGKSVCMELALEGVKVIAVSKGESGLNDLKSEILNKEQHKFIKLDLSKKKSLIHLFNKIKKLKICPDIIVNNVGGTLGFNDPLNLTENLNKVMYLNLKVPIKINELYLPYMIKKKWGRICHISSIAALENQGPPSYCAAKAALNAYVRSVGRYVSENNVIMTSVMPGAIMTRGGYWEDVSKSRPEHFKNFLNERMAIKRFGKVEEISKIVVFMCSDLSSFCVGSNILVDGGQGRVFQS